MAKCVVCGKDSVGECCGGACRAKKSRRARAQDEERTLEKPVVIVGVLAYEIVEDVKVYGRQAVRYGMLREAWDLRPEPLSPNDRPKPGNRGKYIRPDDTEYQFDAIGQVFDCVDGEVYPTMAALRAAQVANKAPDAVVSGQTT